MTKAAAARTSKKTAAAAKPEAVTEAQDPAIVTFHARIAQLKAHPKAKDGDIAAVLKGTGRFALTLDISKEFDKLGIDTGALFAPTAPVKSIKRAVQYVGAIAAKRYYDIDRTSAIIVLGAHQAGDYQLHTDALAYLATGKTMGKDAPDTRGVSRQTLARLIGAVGVNTVQTQLSRSVGKAGFMQILGMTYGEPGKQNRAITIHRDNALVKAFLSLIEGATQGQIDELVTGKVGGEA